MPNLIRIEQIRDLGDFVLTTVATSALGLTLINSVAKTGNYLSLANSGVGGAQLISGTKFFQQDGVATAALNVNDAALGPISLFSAPIKAVNRIFLNDSLNYLIDRSGISNALLNYRVNIDNASLQSQGSTTLDWNSRLLSGGNWSNNSVPVSGQHLVNKTYVDGLTNYRASGVFLSSGAFSGQFSFASPFSAQPRSVQLTMTNPSGGSDVYVSAIREFNTSSGFAYRLSSPTEATGYYLNWLAFA